MDVQSGLIGSIPPDPQTRLKRRLRRRDTLQVRGPGYPPNPGPLWCPGSIAAVGANGYPHR